MMPPATALAEPRRPRVAATAALPLPRADEVDVWHASLDGQSPETERRLQALLSADEADRAQRFYFDRDRRRFVIGRGILRVLLGRYLGVPARDLAFRYGANGKPLLAAPAAPRIHFNAAHSDGLVAFAFASAGDVGVDVERVRELPEWETIATAYFGPRELSRLLASTPEARRAEFFRAWTRQEALLKAHGIGLGGTTGRAGGEETPAALQPGLELAFRLHPLDTEPGFAGALAVPPAVRWLTQRPWSAALDAPSPRRARRTRLKDFSETGSTSS